MLSFLKTKFALFKNRRRRKGLSLQDQCAKVIMHTCSLQLERAESRELASTKGATGPMLLSGGAITTVIYKVFDVDADKVDKQIRNEPWRAFATVTMRLTLERDPEFEVTLKVGEGHFAQVEPLPRHMNPGLALIAHLSTYFPLLPKPHNGPTYAPELGGAA